MAICRTASAPSTQEVGYRRLNVAVTRAKRRMCVISSFSHDEIDLNRSGSRGVQLLKAYLEYAASGGRRLPEEEHAGEVGLNPFEADVRDALEARGIRTRPQFGASRYRIDLVAMHPEKPGRPVLAIECDGASYHSSATARDRDRLRQAHLQRLGLAIPPHLVDRLVLQPRAGDRTRDFSVRGGSPPGGCVGRRCGARVQLRAGLNP